MDRELVRKCMDASQRAYDDKDAIRTANDGINKVEYLIEEWGDTTAIAFQGSNGLADWIQNGDFTQINWQYGEQVIEFHKGFYEQAVLAMLHMITNLGPIRANKLVYTGHSQGAAIANVFSLFQRQAGKDIEVIDFAAPRSTCSKGAHLMDQLYPDHIRVVNGSDIVPTLPPDIDIIGLDYQHSGKLLQLGEAGSFPSFLDHRLTSYSKNFEV